MTRNISTEAEIDSVRLKLQASAPAAPPAGYKNLYIKSAGLYTVDEGGLEVELLGDNDGLSYLAAYEQYTNRKEWMGTSLTDLPTYDAEFLSDTGWTSTDWTGSWAAGWTHTAGNTSPLSQSTPAVIGTKYQIVCNINPGVGNVALSFGGQAINGALPSSFTFGPTATSTAGLVITPSSDFNGIITISIKAVTAVSTPLFRIFSSDGFERVELRAHKGTKNTLLGNNAGGYLTTGVNNTAIGVDALSKTTTGEKNIAIGANSLLDNTTGNYNVAAGEYSLSANLTGYSNVGLGFQALMSSTTGDGNIAVGSYAMKNNTTGYNNVACGWSALYLNTTGHTNAALGVSAGATVSGGGSNLASNTSVYLGSNTKALASGDANEVVIGYNATGLGSNTVVIGNTNITKTALRGAVGIGTESPNANAALDVTSTTKAFMPPRVTTAQKAAIASPTAGMVVFDTDLAKLCVYTTAWEAITSAA